MTDPLHPAPGHAEPTVDDVIRDARELSGLLRDDSDVPGRYAAADQPTLAARPTAVPGTRIPTPIVPGTHVPDPTYGSGTAHGSATAHDAHAPAARGDSHAAAVAHGGGHGASHDEEPLGPVDTAAWGAGLLGTAVGLFIAFCFVLATAGSVPV